MRPIVTKYASSGDIKIAYQTVGQGPFDLVLVPGFISNLDLAWEDEGFALLLRRLSAFSRLILFDKRGTGLSDRVDNGALPDPGTRMQDLCAVMDAAGAGRAAVLGMSDGAPMALLFAATCPDRTRALVLYGGYACFGRWVMAPDRLETFITVMAAGWGTGATLPYFAPGRVEDARFTQWWARLERLSAGPTAAVALARANAAADVRGLLSAIRVPTLLLHRRQDIRVNPEASRYLAQHIAGARLVEIPGRDHPIWTGDVDHIVDLIEEFLTGDRAVRDPDRVLAALLVTCIHDCDRLGDRLWHERCRHFQDSWRLLVARHGGHVAGLQGDILLARFDGPARAIRCASGLREAAQDCGITCAQGLHAGEIEPRGTASGLVVRVARQIAAHAQSGEILLSRLVADLANGSGLHFSEAGSLRFEELDEPLALVHAIPEQHLEPAGHPRPRATDHATLTARESEVVALVAEGLSNLAIAGALRLSEHTVKRHVANILTKLDLPSRAAAAAFAARHTGSDGP